MIVRILPSKAAAWFFSFKHRIWWRTKGKNLHLAYFQEYNSRRPFIEALNKLFISHNRASINFIEFGCSGGNNLRLIREVMSCPVSYCGLDISPDAIAFARQQFPCDRFYVCADTELPKIAPELGYFDVFLVSAVLYYLPPERAQLLLQWAAHLADYVLVCDDLSHFDDDTGSIEGLFLHPYAAICRQVGLEIISPPTVREPGDIHSYFIARSTSSVRDSGRL